MTKKQIIKVIQEADKKLWERLHEVEDLYGYTDAYTHRVRHAWAAVNDIVNETKTPTITHL